MLIPEGLDCAWRPRGAPDGLLEDPPPDLAVQGTEGVVQEEHVRAAVQRPGNADALPLACNRNVMSTHIRYSGTDVIGPKAFDLDGLGMGIEPSYDLI